MVASPEDATAAIICLEQHPHVIYHAYNIFCQQVHPTLSSSNTEWWIKIILGYARHGKLFYIRVEDAETPGNDWDEVLRNPRINRRLPPPYLNHILSVMVSQNQAVYEPAKQDRAVLLHWRQPEEWADVLYNWASSTGQLNTILTFLDITEPPIQTELTNLPIPLLKKAIGFLTRTSKAQIISIADGEGVRFLAER